MDLPKYFALLPTNKLGDALLEKKDEYYRYLENSGRFSLLMRSFNADNFSINVGGGLINSGEHNEYVHIGVNDYANLAQHRLTLTTSQRIVPEPKATNTDVESQRACRIGSSLLEYYGKTKRIERFINQATEYAIKYAEGFVGVFWNPTLGERFGLDQDGNPLFDGDVECWAGNTFDAIRPCGVGSRKKQDWIMIRKFENKHNRAAKYPLLKDRIENLTCDHGQQNAEQGFDEGGYSFEERNSDDIAIYTFIHRKTDALPEGRIFEFSAPDIVYFDGDLPYRDIPVYRIASGEDDRTMFGKTLFFDLLPLQEALFKLDSTILSNIAAFGTQNIVTSKGSGLNLINIREGMNVIEVNPGALPPTPLALLQTPIELFSYRAALKADMETLSGVNSVARGNPEKSLKDTSGTALALVQSQALQFAQGLQQSYAQLIEDVYTALIENLQDYANTPRLALISGKSQRSYMQSFKGEDLKLIVKVTVDMGNPLINTFAGRVAVADSMLQRGLVTSPNHYYETITSGRIDPMYEAQIAEMDLIRDENERLIDGEPVDALISDNHDLHISEHHVPLSSTEVRKNPVLLKTVLDHIMQHTVLKGQLATASLPPVPGMANPQEQEAGQSIGHTAGAISENLSNEPFIEQKAASVQPPKPPRG